MTQSYSFRRIGESEFEIFALDDDEASDDPYDAPTRVAPLARPELVVASAAAPRAAQRADRALARALRACARVLVESGVTLARVGFGFYPLHSHGVYRVHSQVTHPSSHPK